MQEKYEECVSEASLPPIYCMRVEFGNGYVQLSTVVQSVTTAGAGQVRMAIIIEAKQ